MRSLALAGLLAVPTFLVAQQEPQPQLQPQPQLAPLTAAADRVVASLRLSGAGLAIVRDRGAVHVSTHGHFAGDLVIPIASASKWLAVATILQLADEGQLDLDAPVARYVPEFDRADKRTVTLRQCLSCTAGFAPRLVKSTRRMDMKEFAAAAADAPLRGSPGSAFRYSGLSFQVAALAAERVTGKTWHELFEERIAGPLGMRNTKFGALQPVAAEAGTAALPWVAGGAVSTLDDYARFVRMLVAKGEFEGRRVLAQTSVEAMLRDQVPGFVEVHGVGFDAEDVRYGLGTWIAKIGDGATRVSDPGAFGFTPWIDLDLGVGGVFAVTDRVQRVLTQLAALQQQVRDTCSSPLVSGTDKTVNLAHGGRDRRYHLHVPPQPTVGEKGLGAPLVLVLHGGGGSGEQIGATSGFADLADREGFVVAFPDGTGPLRGRLLTWNSGGIKVYAADQEVDDVGFLRQVVRDVQQQVAIDPRRVFVVGHSNGGMMCHRLAREAADVFAGIAVVSGAMNFDAVQAASPIAALLLHGTADEHVRIEGGAPKSAIGRAGDREDASLQAAIDYYVARNDLRAYPQTRVEGDVRIDTYAASRAGTARAHPVRVITLQGGGHAWPGSAEKTTRRADEPFAFDATRAIWDFFAEVGRGVDGATPAPR